MRIVVFGVLDHTVLYGTDGSAGPSDIIFKRFYFEEGGSGFSEDAQTHTHTHTHTGLLTILLSIVTTMLAYKCDLNK